MDVLTITSILGVLPSIYPIYRIARKQELNLFDLIILFHTLNFALVPLWKGNVLHWLDDGIIETFLYYISFVVLLLCLDLFWHTLYEDRVSLINITAYLKKYDRFRISKVGVVLLFLILIVSLVFYMPRATYILHLEDAGVVMEHDEKVYTALLGNFFNIAGVILILYISYNIKRLSIKDYCLWLFLAYMVMNLFFPRRVFLSLLLQIIICVYAIHRKLINLKTVSYLGAMAIFMYLVYFPFYNIMRHGSTTLFFNPSAPIESLIRISSYAFDNWKDLSKDATKASDSRSLGLYDALYNMIYYNPKPCYGELTVKAIDVGIPKYIKPNKGEGSMPLMEKMTKQYTDQADSYLLMAYGDFHFWGSLYTILIFGSIFFAFIIYNDMLWSLFKTNSISLYFILILFGYTWNVENSLDGFLSWFFSSVPSLAIVIILEKADLIKIRNKNNNIVKSLLLLAKYK